MVDEKGETEIALVEFREFRTFTEGLLSQGTLLEIAFEFIPGAVDSLEEAITKIESRRC